MRMTNEELALKYDQIRRYFELPGVIERSVHFLRSGKEAQYYANFDVIVNYPDRASNIIEFFANILSEINLERRVDFLAFIEKQPGGTVGAIRLGAALSIRLGIPNIVIRQSIEVVPEQVKLERVPDIPAMEKLAGANLVLVTDHITGGGEIIRAIGTIEQLGGRVTDVITYTIKIAEFKGSLSELTERNVNLHALFDLYDEGDLHWVPGSTIIASEERLYGEHQQ